MGCFYQTSFLRIKRYVQKGGGGVKDCKSQRWWFTRWKQCLYDTTKQVHISYTCEPTETVTICTRPKQVQTRQNLSTEKAKRKQSLIPNQEAVFSLLFSTGKGKVSFLQWSGAGHIKLTPEQVPSPGVANQQSIASMVLRLYLLFGLVFFFLSY